MTDSLRRDTSIEEHIMGIDMTNIDAIAAIQETLYLNSVTGMAESTIEAKNEPIDEADIYEEGEEW